MRRLVSVLLATGMGMSSHVAKADDIAGFYKGKTITIMSAGGAGGGYGVYAALLAEHLGKHIPGQPNIIVSFNPGGGGIIAANAVYTVSAKDGTAMLAPLQSLSTLQIVGKKGVRYDAGKLQWIGRSAETTSGFVVKPAVAKSLDALRARKQETIVGITAIGAPNHILPALLKYCPGINLKLVSGYKGSAKIALAYQRGEVEALAVPLSSLRVVYPDILKDTMIAQSGVERAKDFAKAPLTSELCKDPAKKKIVDFFQTQELMGRSYAMPPGTPPARVAALRRAFDATMKDPAFLESAKKRKLEVNPMPGAELQKLVEQHIATDANVVTAAKAAVGMN